jgi:DNA polymerase III delta prime subunit
MIQSYIYLTQTSLDLESLSKLVAFNFFTNKTFEINSQSLNCENPMWENKLSSSQILTENFDSKNDLKSSITGYYQKYNKPTLLFLGDLSSYSQLLQEGMLKLLEEPPHNLFIICFAKSKSELLQTVLSRCKIISLEQNVVAKFLDQKLLEKTKKSFPEIDQTVKKILKNEVVGQEIDFTKAERAEIQFWLWQIEYYLKQVYLQQPNQKIASSLEKVIKAQNLNNQNLQKKFVVGWLNYGD